MKIPKPRARAPQAQLMTLIFGEVDDPTKPPRETRYKDMRAAAKRTYHRIVVPESGAEGVPWNRLSTGLQERAVADMLKEEEFHVYFERSVDNWLPKYLLSTYSKSYLDYRKKSGLGQVLDDSLSSGLPDAQPILPGIEEWFRID
ncbi:hypothetical protein DRE_04399 [Drechslerella stenobrocha 248]|uniref:Uncharacterized protein n=1 Tax=Drechslerella stenobrocha 248 TaxID=1043628 RepID=W7HQL4_9PEZI|nr:hypothetical protein DRE_04399 [Drechslerella stenobrocha 248]